MKNVLLASLLFSSLGSSRPGCGPFRPESDGASEEKPHKVAEICVKLDMECTYSCFRREASNRCAVCCNDNLQRCDHDEKYDFTPCELIDPAPAPAPDAGTGDAGSNTAPAMGSTK